MDIFRYSFDMALGFIEGPDMPLYDCNDFECLFIAQLVRRGGTP